MNRDQITDRFALKLAAIVKANHHSPRGADIEAMLERAKSLTEKHPADGLGEIFTMDEFEQSLKQ